MTKICLVYLISHIYLLPLLKQKERHQIICAYLFLDNYVGHASKLGINNKFVKCVTLHRTSTFLSKVFHLNRLI